MKGHKEALILGILALLIFPVYAGSSGNGNPMPGYPHDTITIHVHPDNGNPIKCDGGHALHVRADDATGGVKPVNISITMQDWRQQDNDGDGLYDEDPKDGVDNDGDGRVDEDPKEPGAETRAVDCDGIDGDISMQIRDADPRAGWVSTQDWFIRLTGKPDQAFNFTSYANHTVSCTSTDPGLDGLVGTEDDTYQCNYEYVNLGPSDLSGLKTVGKGGKGKTSFEDITDLFLVDVDVEGDGVYDLFNRPIFSVSCPDNSSTPINETLDVCPLGSAIWDIDQNTGTPLVQIFVSHTGSTKIVGGAKIGKPRKK